MATEADWLMRPVKQGMCRYESLLDGTVDLADIAEMNDCLDVDTENEFRLQEALKEQ
jgi:hypothetical protein